MHKGCSIFSYFFSTNFVGSRKKVMETLKRGGLTERRFVAAQETCQFKVSTFPTLHILFNPF